LVLNYLNVPNARRARCRQGKEKEAIKADTPTSTQVKMMRVKM
jgi:hypothetical protein